MRPFWEYRFEDSASLVETFDELPFWSAPFGELLLGEIELRPYELVLDIGSGTGFPLVELAERLGGSSRCIGIDPWSNANERARKKIQVYGANNVELLEASAEKIPLGNSCVDLIVSNLGINNFENPAAIFAECRRVLKPGGCLSITTNLFGHWKIFYAVFEETLRELKKPHLIAALKAEEAHRRTARQVCDLYTHAGFRIRKTVEKEFKMNFLSGTAFLNHHFIKMGWLSSWQKLIPEQEWEDVFTGLEKRLNSHAKSNSGLNLKVPMAYFEGEKTL